MALKNLSTARIKRRYFLVDSINRADVEKSLSNELGTLGLAKAKLVFVDIKGNHSRSIVFSIDRTALSAVHAAIEISPLPIRVLAVSGTLKGLFSKR